MTIYFLRSAETNLIKIGTTDNYPVRFSQLRKEYGDLQLLGLMEGDRTIEQRLHRRFTNERVNPRHEWFNESPRLLAFIAKYGVGKMPERKGVNVEVSALAVETLKLLKIKYKVRSIREALDVFMQRHYPRAWEVAIEIIESDREMKELVKRQTPE